ncbi:MAG: glycosyltransferase family 4 protein [Syntrophobacteraceae bacterium]|nr:glycosyltransferase family 4 protein [Syntrophobacteraceae bacterium]
MKTVYHLHFGRIPQLVQDAGWEWLALKHAIGIADVVIALDCVTFDVLRHEFPHKSIVKVPNCLDLRQLLEITGSNKAPHPRRNVPRVVYIGWMIPAKGVFELVNASFRVARFLPFQLEIIGPCDPKYLSSVSDAGNGLGDRLIIRGELPHQEAMKSLSQADILVLPSYTEGFPNVVIEAMALGKPVIGTDVGAIPEMLSDIGFGPCGIVVPPRDVNALENALRILLSDAELRKNMGESARAKFEECYDVKVVFEQLMNLWTT